MLISQTLALLLGALIAEGNPAPDFSARDQAGHPISLKALRGKPVVLYFYPKDQTPGCTVEARGFRDHQGEFEKLGAVVLGVSSQTQKSHEAFAEAEKLGFSLLDDRERVVAKAYGVGEAIPFTGLDARVTFLIDRAGVVRKVWPDVDPNQHPAEVLAALAQLK